MAPWILKRGAHFSTVITLISLLTVSRGDAGDEGTSVRHLRREKRGWVWNQFFVLEEYAEDKPLYVGKLHSDFDKGDGSVKYVLSGEGAGTTFTLDDSTEQYILRAQATHRHTGHALEPESRFIVKIQDINDNEPKFLDGPYQATVPEMSAVGEVRVSLPDMDREVKGQYEVVIQAKDMAGQLGGLAGTTTVNITLSDVNDNPPHFPQKLYQISVPESAPVGTVVGHIEAHDLDLGVNAEMRYRVTDGHGREAFDISADSTNTYGVVTVKQRLDFETKQSYTLKVEAANTHTDTRFFANRLLSDITTMQVSVLDVDEPPQFSSALYYAEIREDAKIGTVLISVSARDPDAANSSVRYMIDRVSDPDQYFAVSVSSGSLKTVLPLDREKISWHNLTIVAIETNVNDNPPSIAHHHEAFLCDNAGAGQLVQSIRAVDADEPIGGQHFSYTLIPEAQKNPNFTLIDNHDNSARVLTRRGSWAFPSVYHLPITVSDGGTPIHSSTHILTIRVCECDPDGDVSSCQKAEPHTLPANLSTAALTTMLTCGSVALVMLLLMLFLSNSSTKKTLLSDEEENVRENIVHYDDEGGGEEDTVAFDITKLWRTHTEALCYAELVLDGVKPWHVDVKDVKTNTVKVRQEKPPEIQSLSNKHNTNANDSNVYSYVLARLCEVDLDAEAPPYDSLQTYAYEGEGSVAESLSSLQSNDDNEHNYDYLDEWGPRFHTLAQLYGTSESNV
ncbi:Cadherin-20 [Bagarius yarrelli]|uniref:Cadherin-20 n=1 Tax=Bagarius yarrelli TaxID=175774 RepID=A0A556VW84_BAGYA|nr:Cadherin-20 [Bagarius yarrelli]